MWEQIVTLFTEMGTLSAVFLLIGMVLGIIEVFIPGFGIFGIMGIIMSVLGIVFRILVGISLTQVFILIFIVLAAFLLLFLIFTYSARFGLLSRTGIVESGTAVSKDYNSDAKNFAYLLGKIGATSTVCKPVGKVTIENVDYQVFSSGEYLPKGVNVKVIEVDGSNIIVKKI
ncbi:MAG: NfeD family protein [Spirochaetales bacterium]